MARTHTFKGTGANYFAYIEEGQLVIGEDWGREGGIVYRGPYEHAGKHLANLQQNAEKLYNSIVKYYTEEAKKEETGIIYRFKDSRDRRGNGYSGYVDRDGKLVLEYDDPRNGGCYFRGSYSKAVEEGYLRNLKVHDPVLYEAIEKYFIKHGVKDDTEDLKKKYSFDESTKTVLFKVQLYMENRQVHNVLVRGRSQAGVVDKLMPKIPEVLMLQTWDAREFAVRSEKIYAIEFVED